MYLIVIAWIYVVLLMAVVEASSPAGTLLGALITLALYGLLPLGVVVYILSTPARRRAIKARAAAEQASPGEESIAPDTGGEAPAAAQGGSVAAVREEA